jgi:hypothetical protein
MTPDSMKPANTSTILGHLYKFCFKSRRPKYTRNHFQEALVFPQFGLLVEANAMNHHLSCDHRALTESSEDCTKAVVQGVDSDASAEIVVNYLDAHKKSISCINDCRCILLNVTSPEDRMKKMNGIVDVLAVEQVMKCSEFHDGKVHGSLSGRNPL